MLVGRDTVRVWRQGVHNREGDAPWSEVDPVTRCNLQAQGLSRSKGSVRSDGVSMYAVRSDAVLYVWYRADLRKGDRVVNSADGNAYMLNTDLIENKYPSGQVAGWLCFMDRVDKW